MFFGIIINDDGCYSIWPKEKGLPRGWRATGFFGSDEVALNQVAELWRAKALRSRDGNADILGPENTRSEDG